MKLLLGRIDIFCLMFKDLSVALDLWVSPSALFPVYVRAAKAFDSLHVNDEISDSMCGSACAHATYAGLRAAMAACHAAGVADQRMVHSPWHIFHWAISLV